MKDEKQLIFIRHGHSVANGMSLDELAATGMHMTEYPLTDRGRVQCRITASYIKDTFEHVDLIMCSNYVRAVQTALLIYPWRKITIDPNLGESNFGVWMSKTRTQIELEHPDEIERFQTVRPYLYRPLDGENWQDIEYRISSVIAALNDIPFRRAVLVGHGLWFNLFERLVENLDVEEIEQRFSNCCFVSNASVSLFKYENGIIVRQSDTVTPWRGKI